MRVIRLEGGEARTGGMELAGPGAPIWIDLAPTEEGLAFLAARFRFHPLALAECEDEDLRAKIEPYPDHLFAVVHRVSLKPEDDGLDTAELNAFLTAEALVTVHIKPIAELDRVFERVVAEPGLLGRGPDFCLYLVHDALTDVHFAVADALTVEAEHVAEEVTSGEPEPDVAQRISTLRRQHATLRRRLSPQREVFAGLARPGTGVVREPNAVYFRNVQDQVVRLAEEADMGRDLLASAMEAYLSQTNNRLTNVTTRLTLIATIFLPLNFVAGFFGMNLEVLPAAVAVPLVLVTVVLVPVGMWAFFRHEGWL